MDEHSVEAYLHRLSSAELEGFLWQCAYLRGWDSSALAVPQILEILKARGRSVKAPILESWEAHLRKNQSETDPPSR